MKITAVIVAYWPDRFPNISAIVRDLLANTLQPDHIIVVNNNHRATVPPMDGASVVNCGWNYTSRSKYGIAMMEPSDYYLLLDDDVSVESKCLEYFASIAYPGCCMSDCGAVMKNNFASHAKCFKGQEVYGHVNVDLFLGSLQFVSFNAIVSMFIAESKVRLPHIIPYRSVAEDFLIALANRPNSRVVGLSPSTPERDIKGRKQVPVYQGSGAMQHDHGYYAARNRFVYDAWVALGNQPFPGDVPEDLQHPLVQQYFSILFRRDRDEIPMENRTP